VTWSNIGIHRGLKPHELHNMPGAQKGLTVRKLSALVKSKSYSCYLRLIYDDEGTNRQDQEEP
jgi:hypothetical protein